VVELRTRDYADACTGLTSERLSVFDWRLRTADDDAGCDNRKNQCTFPTSDPAGSLTRRGDAD